MPAGGDRRRGTRADDARARRMPLVVNYSTQETNGQRIGIAEVILAPLAVGQYRLELSYDVDGQRETVSYEFRIVP